MAPRQGLPANERGVSPSTLATAKKKPPGRPPTGIGKPLGLRLHAEVEAALDAWITDQPERPLRVEAIRRLLTEALRERGYLPRGAA